MRKLRDLFAAPRASLIGRKAIMAAVVAVSVVTAGIATKVGIQPVEAQITTNGSANAPRVPPRMFSEQTVHYIRTTLTFNMCTQVSNACVVKFTNAALPYNAIIVRANAMVYTAFNSTTSDTVSLGTTSANANEIVSSATSIHSTGLAAMTLASTAQSATGAGTTQSGDNGGFNVFAKWTAGIGNTATAGVADVLLEYIAPNDGTCTPVPLGTTANAC